MAPLLWLNLLLFFLGVFALFLIINYFLITPQKIASSPKLAQGQNKTWSW